MAQSILKLQLPSSRWGMTGLAVSTCLGAVVSVRMVQAWLKKRDLANKRKNKQLMRRMAEEELGRNLKKCEVTTERQKYIMSLKIKELQEKLQTGELKATEVLYAYQCQAIKVNQTTNAITEYVSEAAEDAAMCDQVNDRSQRLLHGIPISIKECFPMQGYDVVLGMSTFLDQPWTDDCVIVKVLREQGAIPFVRTNVSQALLSFESCNPVYGKTRNPHDLSRSVGGSSGGEAALQASGGSIIGLGGDIGGSIRIPAAFCGTYGLKPTSTRISTKGCHSYLKGQNLVTSAYGPMTRDVDGLVLMMKALASPLHFQLDKTIPPVPFREEMYTEKRKYKVGYYLDNGHVTSTPHMKRAVIETVNILKSLGHEVIELDIGQQAWRAGYLWGRAIFSDGGKELLDLMKHDAVDPSIARTCTGVSVSKIPILFPILCKIVAYLAFKLEVSSYLENKGIEVMIAPGFASPAMPLGGPSDAFGAASYTMMYNLLDYPVGSMPVTKTTREDNVKMVDYPSHDPWHKAIKEMFHNAEGLPVNVQVVSLPWHEERCLRVMKELEVALENSK